jgi:hypothetical protein
MSSRCPKPPTRVDLAIILYVILALAPAIVSVVAMSTVYSTADGRPRNVMISIGAALVAVAGHFIAKRLFRRIVE